MKIVLLGNLSVTVVVVVTVITTITITAATTTAAAAVFINMHCSRKSGTSYSLEHSFLIFNIIRQIVH
jgi:hypothetical protein